MLFSAALVGAHRYIQKLRNAVNFIRVFVSYEMVLRFVVRALVRQSRGSRMNFYGAGLKLPASLPRWKTRTYIEETCSTMQAGLTHQKTR